MSDTELSTPSPAAQKGNASEGDWTCEECGNVNFAWRNACNRCAKARAPTFQKKKKLGQEIGKQAAEKSRGLFSADDWQCNKCGNVNWARRQQCNVCNAPKFGEVEERTGFGGGYNDRGIVEYKDREDSDDEYDEFGRRRKKRERSSDNGVSSCSKKDNKHREPERVKDLKVEAKASKHHSRVVEDDDDDDEEEDDDGDLSKYDLSDWGDNTAVKNNVAHSFNYHQSKRSKSRSKSRSRCRSRSRSRSRSPISKSSKH